MTAMGLDGNAHLLEKLLEHADRLTLNLPGLHSGVLQLRPVQQAAPEPYTLAHTHSMRMVCVPVWCNATSLPACSASKKSVIHAVGHNSPKANAMRGHIV